MHAEYMDYLSEDDLFEAEMIYAMVQLKKNSKRKEEPYVSFIKQCMRKGIETTFSKLKAKMLRTIHAVTEQGFLLKVASLLSHSALKKLLTGNLTYLTQVASYDKEGITNISPTESRRRLGVTIRQL